MNLSGIPFTDGTVTPGEAWGAWGDYDAEWIAIKCCSLLNDASKGYWYTTFDGLHLLLGYKTSSFGYTNFGRIWANKMRKTTILWLTIPGQTITQAWFNTTDQTQPSGTTARVLTEVYDNYNDHLWGNGYVSPDPTYNGWYWWWDHTAGSPAYRFVNSLETMNVYEVVRRQVDRQYVKQIAAAFTVTGEVGEDCESFVMVNDKEVLEVSKATGHYYYQDHSRLFYPDPDARLFPLEQAENRASGFLRENKLLPGDAGASTVEFDTIVEESQDKGAIRQELQQNTCVVFAREIPGNLVFL